MSVARLRQTNAFHHDPKFGRLLLASLIIHGLVWVGFSADWFGASTRPKPPVYYVDLIHKPVLNPQAGRPDPRPAKQQKAAPVKRSVTTTSAPKPKPKVKIPAKTAQPAKPKPVAKATPKKDQAAQSSINDALDRIKRQAERDALKDKIAKLAQATGAAATIPEDVPVGMPDGTGTDAGISHDAYIRGYIQQNWALSPYLLEKSRMATIETKVKVFYSQEGTLVGFPKVIEGSGDKQFDDSVMRAIIKSKQLEQKLQTSGEYVLVFNLKEMATLRR